MHTEYDLDIGLWHQLTTNPLTKGPYLSSRRLLAFLERSSEDGAFKTAAERGGRWPSWMQMLKELTNEAYRFRASFHAANSTTDNDARFDPTPFEFVDPVDQEAAAKVEAEKESAAQRFNSELGYS